MRQSFITNVTPLPPTTSRETAVTQLHDHHAMIELNPLVIRHELTDPPPNASPDEAQLATWYLITDKINYLPGGVIKGYVSYKACFYNLPNGIQTHVFAPAGVEIKSKWIVGGNMPGEEREASELGVDKPKEGLYIKEELDLRCNILMSNFVKRNLKKSHQVVVEKIIQRADKPEVQTFSTISPLSAQSGHQTGTNPKLFSRAPTVLSGLTSIPTGSDTTQYREIQLSCACEGTVHLPACTYFHPDDLENQEFPPLRQPKPYYAISLPASASSYSESSIAHSPHLERSMSELYGSTGPGQCLCTGALHEQSCPSYPGLRLPNLPPPISLPSPSSSIQQSPQNDHAPSSAPPVIETTHPALRHKSNLSSGFAAQRPGEQAELSAVSSPVDNDSPNRTTTPAASRVSRNFSRPSSHVTNGQTVQR